MLCLDALREAEEKSNGRIKVKHTLTDYKDPVPGEKPKPVTYTSNYNWVPGRHFHFTSQCSRGPLVNIFYFWLARPSLPVVHHILDRVARRGRSRPPLYP